jgi:enoyl-CoA hydratase
MTDSVLVSTDGPVGRITLNEPDRLNAVDPPMLQAIQAAVESFDADPAVRVIVITGAGRAFCSGANLAVEVVDGRREVPDATLFDGGRLVRAMVAARTPVLTLVNGVAAGMGLSIALAADYVLANERASFVLAFSNIGLMPDGGATALVAASVGRARALRMALTAEKVSAVTAGQWGLVSETCSEEEFAGRSAALIDRLAGLAPTGTAYTTQAVNAASLDLDRALALEEPGQAELLQSDDFQEGMAAFFGKRKPVYLSE